ncbi:dihydrolipoyl dehydrogenase family protein [Mycoplasmopsis gallopavonis]|uniref:Thioredoxin reductase n=1 Tax=Mycoplasmopsis gallopavonis TaxID=76629 RepID=A0A449AZZ2_9BACT|nr:NAD(P)/FAD-dependent oxidoreductase [Mycoplasmopsis gallopavonis]RIV16433.1 NAD(P)/FAD-dependent oxidoreductase [Mycoplasmopsis gallopavonis]VEU73045.1 thioredoxin reductase [Mycoplasmopsis gallopavonis]
MKQFDLLIIGWGKAGKTIAARAATDKLKVAIVEIDPLMYGGTCINVGCLPTKSLVHSGKLLKQMEDLGMKRDFETNNFYFQNAMNYKRTFVEKLNQKNYQALANLEDVSVFLGQAEFVSDQVVKVVKSNGQEELIKANKIVINTGSTPRKWDLLENYQGQNIHYSNQILELKTLPKKLLIVGGGFIGLEFASYFNNFGSEVHVIIPTNDFMPSEDHEDAQFVLKLMQKQGIKFHFNTKVEQVNDLNSELVEVTLQENNQIRKDQFDKILVAIGRVPNIETLKLENTSIQVEKGAIKVNDYLETTVKNIFAVGDVKGGAFFTYISLDDYRIVYPQIINKQAQYNLSERKNIPTTTFLDPSYARSGLNEKQAKSLGINYQVKYALTNSIPKAHVIRETEGFTKILIDENDQIIGATIFHYEAHEMINLLTLAINKKLKYQELRDMIYTHPIYTESLNEILK